MKITATIDHGANQNLIFVQTDEKQKSISIPGKTDGKGSSVNGGELLFLSLATCFCNDLYREASKRNMQVDRVEVTVRGDFGGEGDPASQVRYQVRVEAPSHTETEIRGLIDFVDNVAEIHKTLRQGVAVTLEP